MSTLEKRIDNEIKRINKCLDNTHDKIKKTLYEIRFMDIEVDKYHDGNHINWVINELSSYTKILMEYQEDLRYYLLAKHSLNTTLYGDSYEKIIYNKKLGMCKIAEE